MPSKASKSSKSLKLPAVFSRFAAIVRRVYAPFGRWGHAHKFLATILLILLGFIIYRTTVVQIDKYKFHQAEVALDAVAKNLEQSSVNPTVSKVCAAPDAKFGKAALQCTMGLEYEISDLSAEAETRLVKNFIEAIDRTGKFKKVEIEYPHPLSGFDQGGGSIELNGRFNDCGLLYHIIHSTSRFRVSLTCYIRPKFSIY